MLPPAQAIKVLRKAGLKGIRGLLSGHAPIRRAQLLEPEGQGIQTQLHDSQLQRELFPDVVAIHAASHQARGRLLDSRPCNQEAAEPHLLAVVGLGDGQRLQDEGVVELGLGREKHRQKKRGEQAHGVVYRERGKAGHAFLPHTSYASKPAHRLVPRPRSGKPPGRLGPDLADLRHRGRQPARSGAVDARREPFEHRPSGP